MLKQLSILAPGLLGASAAMAAHEAALAQTIAVWARRAEVRIACAEQTWCSRAYPTPHEAVEGADLVLICTPVAHIAPLVAQIAPHLKPGAIVTDVGSTKSLICRESQHALPQGRHFIGSHPMAGSERTGMANAKADLFFGKPCFVTPLIESDAAAVETVVRFWRHLGMDILSETPEKHDEIVAHISHLPHLLASTLCSQLAATNDHWRNYAGNGLRDTTRVAAGSVDMWKAIIEQNREEILRAIGGFEEELQRLKAAIANRHILEVGTILERGKNFRDRMPGHHDDAPRLT